MNRAARGFAGSDAFIGRFDSVIHGVANQMGQRFSQRVKNALVEIRVLAGELKHDVLILQLGHVAHDTREAAEKLVDGNHADLHYGFVKFVEHARLESQRIGEFSAKWIFRMAAFEFVDACAATLTCR